MGAITDWGTAVVTSFTAALTLAIAFIPKLIGCLLILLIGWFVARGVERLLVWLLNRVGFNRVSDRIGLTNIERRMGMHLDTVTILGKIAFWFIFLVFIVPAIEALGLTAVSNLLNTIIDYIPNVFVAILVLFLGTLAATFVGDIVRGAVASTRIGNPNIFGNIAKYAIIGFAGILALYQLQIAPAIIQTLFTAIVFALAGGLALAFGLAFGLGGRDSASRWLTRGENMLTTTAAQMNARQTAQRSIDQARNVAEAQSDIQPEDLRNRQYAANAAPQYTPQPQPQYVQPGTTVQPAQTYDQPTRPVNSSSYTPPTPPDQPPYTQR